MNNGVPVDLLKIVERLEGAGVPHEQAKALAEVIDAERKSADARYLPRDDLAHELFPIKSGIDKVDAKVERLEIKIDKSAAEVKFEIMRWTVSVWFLQFGLLAALLFKLAA